MRALWALLLRCPRLSRLHLRLVRAQQMHLLTEWLALPGLALRELSLNCVELSRNQPGWRVLPSFKGDTLLELSLHDVQVRFADSMLRPAGMMYASVPQLTKLYVALFLRDANCFDDLGHYFAIAITRYKRFRSLHLAYASLSPAPP